MRRKLTRVFSICFLLLLFISWSDFALAAPHGQDDLRAQADALFQGAVQAATTGQLERAIEKYNEARRIYQQVDDVRREAECLISIGQLSDQLGKPLQARRAFEESLPLLDEVGETGVWVAAHFRIASIDLDRADWASARAHLEQVVSNALTDDLVFYQIVALTTLGRLDLQEGQPEAALPRFAQARSLALEFDQPSNAFIATYGLAGVWNTLANSQFDGQEYTQALDSYSQSLNFYQEVATATANTFDPSWVLSLEQVYRRIGEIHVIQGRYVDALQSYAHALEICRTVSGDPCETVVLNNLGETYDKLGQYPDALENHEQALAACRKIETCAAYESQILHNLGRDYLNLGRYEDAEEFLQKALKDSHGKRNIHNSESKW